MSQRTQSELPRFSTTTTPPVNADQTMTYHLSNAVRVHILHHITAVRCVLVAGLCYHRLCIRHHRTCICNILVVAHPSTAHPPTQTHDHVVDSTSNTSPQSIEAVAKTSCSTRLKNILAVCYRYNMTTTNHLGYIVPHGAFADVSAASINGFPVFTAAVLGSGALFDTNTVNGTVRALNRAPLTGVAATEQTLSLPPGAKIWDVEVANISAVACDARFDIGTNVTPALVATTANVAAGASTKLFIDLPTNGNPGYVTTQRETLQIRFTTPTAALVGAPIFLAIVVRFSL